MCSLLDPQPSSLSTLVQVCVCILASASEHRVRRRVSPKLPVEAECEDWTVGPDNPEWGRRTQQGVGPPHTPPLAARSQCEEIFWMCVFFFWMSRRFWADTQQTPCTTTFSRPLHPQRRIDFRPYNQIVVLTPLTLVLLRSPATAVTGAMALQTCAQVHKGASGWHLEQPDGLCGVFDERL